MLQLCVGQRCLVFQVFRSAGDRELPEALKNFLEEDHIWVGADIGKDVERLSKDCNVKMVKTYDVQDIVPRIMDDYKDRGIRARHKGREKLEVIAAGVLRKPIEKVIHEDPEIFHSKWGEEKLDDEHVKYAAIDAFLSYQIDHELMLKYPHELLFDDSKV